MFYVFIESFKSHVVVTLNSTGEMIKKFLFLFLVFLWINLEYSSNVTCAYLTTLEHTLDDKFISLMEENLMYE